MLFFFSVLYSCIIYLRATYTTLRTSTVNQFTITEYWPKIPPEPPPMASFKSSLCFLPSTHLSNQHSYQSNPNEPHNEPTYVQQPLVNKSTNDSYHEPNQTASGEPPYVKQPKTKPPLMTPLMTMATTKIMKTTKTKSKKTQQTLSKIIIDMEY